MLGNTSKNSYYLSLTHAHIATRTHVATGLVPHGLAYQQNKFFHDVKSYYWDEPYLYKECANGVIRRYVSEQEIESILRHCHSLEVGGHYGANWATAKVYQSRYYWSTILKDAHEFVSMGDRYQRTGNITWKNEMPLQSTIEVELFDI